MINVGDTVMVSLRHRPKGSRRIYRAQVLEINDLSLRAKVQPVSDSELQLEGPRWVERTCLTPLRVAQARVAPGSKT